ncbi:iron-containing alcohol dehydrogenase family protein [Hydrogenoanaerobacterium sp.]|uniref:iron-containing alcohol dehydrogenase family protein n=1 Tax=Hydrogenoanaerobacterium sp. TaxID=2953763 RepID=UPI00289DA12C|nr:iron-containing alcohol dehydrogenase family protein [Hydrogenoanaerobacterium sp.]
MNFDFYLPTHVISGTGCVRNGGAVFSSLGRKCLIVTGKNSAKACGALDDCTAVLDEQGIAYQVFDGIGQNPLLSSCETAGQVAREFGAEFLIGIGGGSPLDATKAIAFFACNDLHGTDIYGDLPKNALPMVLIGTTAGTGSEVTPYSVLTIDETGRKRSFRDKHGLSYASYVFSDPNYTASLSYDFTVSTALDALCHAIEGYFASTATDISDLFATRGIAVIVKALESIKGKADGAEITMRERELLLYGSLYAGVTINTTGTGFCHPLGYFLTEEYQVPHGQACAIFLRGYLDEAKEHLCEKYAALFSTLGYGDSTVSTLIGELLNVKLPSLTEEQLREVAQRSAPTANFLHSPGVFTEEKAFELLKKVFQA